MARGSPELIDVIFDLFDAKGDSAYFGEPVSQLEHALQVAHLAEQAGSPDSLVVAGLLHDVGHLVHGEDEEVADRGLDARHEDAGASWLVPHFPAEVVRPIQLHVVAKRYLCAVEPSYHDALSAASRQSLKLQGGAMTPAEAARFEADPFHEAAVRLRRWDDQAKVPGLAVPPLAHYRGRIVAALAGRPQRG